MSDTLERFDVGGLTVRIVVDQDCPSPREDDNLGTIVGWHRSYLLGDDEKRGQTPRRTHETPDDFLAWTKTLKGDDRIAVMLPVAMFDHSGVALYIGNGPHTFDPGGWDSGQVGWIYATRKAVKENFTVKRITEATLAKAKEVLTGEVEEYGRYVNGETYGYVVEDPDGESVDSCWGFIGFDYVKDEATSAAKAALAAREKGRDQDREARDDA
jgi:hypothetical protein